MLCKLSIKIELIMNKYLNFQNILSLFIWFKPHCRAIISNQNKSSRRYIWKK